jgi:hypothetical protein
MNSQTFMLLRALRHQDASRIDELFPADRRLALLAAIISGNQNTDVEHQRTALPSLPLTVKRRSLRRPLALSAFAATAAGAIAAIVLSTTSAVSPVSAQAVTFRSSPSGDIIATVTDPFAAQAQLNAAFAKQGLKITVKLLPTSPSIVGTVLASDESNSAISQITPLQGGHCLSGGGGCAIGIEIPRDFRGEGTIYLGRPAKPGEQYESTTSAFAPGEPLHCSGLLGARVSAALPVLQKDGLTVVEWREDSESAPGVSPSVTLSQPPAQNYTWDAELIEPGRLRVTTESTPWPNTPGAGSQYNGGCSPSAACIAVTRITAGCASQPARRREDRAEP